jgi:hypothetical protein
MKLILLIILASVAAFGAETNIVNVFTTNYVAAASNLREVDGQLYDITKSVKWELIRCKYQNQSGELAVFQKIDHVKTGEHETIVQSGDGLGKYSPERVMRPTFEDRDGEFILLKNFPAAHVVTGQEFSPRLLRISETNFNGSIVAIYDCGKPHLVPVVTSKIIKQ